jgi:mycothiol system anti-sigma-R factor
MICRDVKRVVYFFLDGSLGPNKQQDFDKHLKLCPDCETRTRLQERLRAFLQRRVTRISAAAPDHLKTRLTRSIRAFRAEWSSR